MSWLNKIEPITVHQSSEIPYVIKSNGVFLCFDNSYSTRRTQDKFNLAFKLSPQKTKKQSANYVSIDHFPYTVPFSDIVYLNNTILNGEIIKKAHCKPDEDIKILVCTPEHIEKLSSAQYEDFVDSMQTYNKSFILVNDNISPRVRLLDELATTIYHNNDYARTCTAIAHYASQNKTRKYRWTESVPDMDVYCFGNIETAKMSDWFETIGVKSADIHR